MEPQFKTFIHLDLKYCERCGGLWLRPSGTDTPYCAACLLALAEMPMPKSRGERLITSPSTPLKNPPPQSSPTCKPGRNQSAVFRLV